MRHLQIYDITLAEMFAQLLAGFQYRPCSVRVGAEDKAWQLKDYDNNVSVLRGRHRPAGRLSLNGSHSHSHSDNGQPLNVWCQINGFGQSFTLKQVKY